MIVRSHVRTLLAWYAKHGQGHAFNIASALKDVSAIGSHAQRLCNSSNGERACLPPPFSTAVQIAAESLVDRRARGASSTDTQVLLHVADEARVES